jgi:magnesium chelatase subunit D
MPSAWEDALLAAQLFARNPVGLCGIRLRARAGPVRDRWVAYLKALLPPAMPCRKLPAHISEERLLGGLDLTATLAANRPVAQTGVLAESDGGVIIVPMAERIAPHVTSALATALDDGALRVERDGMTMHSPARIGVVLLDEGVDADETPPAALIERMALVCDLEGVTIGEAVVPVIARDSVSLIIPTTAGSLQGNDGVTHDAITSLCTVAMMMGIDSARAPMLALRVAQAAAAWEGMDIIDEDHLTLAARLVLMPRARRMPPMPEQDAEPSPSEADQDDQDQSDTQSDEDEKDIGQIADKIADKIIDAVRAALPAGVLIELEKAAASRGSSQLGRGSAGVRKSLLRGRPSGVRLGKPGAGARLHLVETLRAAAPWQRIRRAQSGRNGVIVMRDDFRIRRFEQKNEATMIFVVDASGSAAMERLGETKGAVELLLAEAYVRRTQVALVAFRGQAAEIILPPTRSLARAKKCLAGLAGGGGTPLAAGIEAGQVLAETARGKGRAPFVILMTDGRANIGRDGTSGRAKADDDAQAAARRFGISGFKSVLIDIASRPRDEGRRMAMAMGARYVALPRVDAAAMRDVVKIAID